MFRSWLQKNKSQTVQGPTYDKTLTEEDRTKETREKELNHSTNAILFAFQALWSGPALQDTFTSRVWLHPLLPD